MIKIYLVLDCRAATRNMSGVGRYILNLIKELEKHDTFKLGFLVRKDFHPDLLTVKNSKLIFLPDAAESIHYINRLQWEQGQLRKLLLDAKPDIFHATWNYGIPLLPTCPTVLTLHDLLPMEFPAEFGSRSWRYAYLLSQYIALYRASKIIAVSQYTKNQVANYARFAVKKTSVILEGVEKEFSPSSKELQSRPYLLYVGGSGERKNLANLLSAYDYAVNGCKVLNPLYLTGTLDRLHDTEKAAYQRMSTNAKVGVNFLGFVDEADLPALYRGAIALIFPSLGEGFGFPPLEAMACATPVITTECGSIPEVVGNAAYFINGRDPVSIAGGIAEVVRNCSLRESMIESGLQRANALSWKACADATVGIYSEIFDGGRSL